MYPHVTQFESRRRDLERRLAGRPENPRARDAQAGRETSGPRRYKLALLTWAAAYSVITLMLAVLGRAMASWPLALRTLVLSVTMVVALTWLIMPRLTRLFRPWLSAGAR
jgi:antibiotic biosynthesis monooxygenase (ABM) superfamily enzyme